MENAKKVLNNYIAQRKAGKDPVFFEDDIEGIGELEAWKRNRKWEHESSKKKVSVSE